VNATSSPVDNLTRSEKFASDVANRDYVDKDEFLDLLARGALGTRLSCSIQGACSDTMATTAATCLAITIALAAAA